MERVEWERDTVGNDQDLSGVLGRELNGGQDGAVGCVVLGDVLADADGGLGVAD